MDEPEDVIRLITDYPEFKPMYDEAYRMCRNMENIMGLFSEELRILDENTVQYMIDEMQDAINEMREIIGKQQGTIDDMKEQIGDKDSQIEALQQRIKELQQK